MNQFVPIFLGVEKAPYDPPRAADTQKCIRAGGKHNDLDDVGLDTYHHTFFEMLGNWSFGDYFKKEAIAWAWELVIERLEAPRQPPVRHRLSARQAKATPASSTRKPTTSGPRMFRAHGLDPDVHIVNGNKKDNFWMMGDTGPCGPCTEIHVDLTPERRHPAARLVNNGSARCIEIWNLVFIQFNANPDGTFTPAARQARRYRHGLRARLLASSRAPRASPTSRTQDLQLRDRHLPPDLRRARRTERQDLRQHLPEPGADRSAFDRGNENRHRLPRHRRPHPHAQLRHRRRHPARQQRPQLRPPPHPPPRRPLRPPARLLRTSRSSTSWWTPSSAKWATSSRN